MPRNETPEATGTRTGCPLEPALSIKPHGTHCKISDGDLFYLHRKPVTDKKDCRFYYGPICAGQPSTHAIPLMPRRTEQQTEKQTEKTLQRTAAIATMWNGMKHATN